MALIEQRIIDQIEIVSTYKHLQIREADQIVDDQTGEVKSSKFHRRVLECGSDVSNEDAEIQATANLWWTQARKDAFATFKASQEQG